MLLLFISIPFLAEIKLQLDENFQFVGKDAYDNVFSIDGLDEILKSHIQQLLLDSYGSELLEVRLKDMDQENLSKQKYVYIRSNISKVNRVEFNVGGNFDFRTSKQKDKDNTNQEKKIGVTESIMAVTAGLEFYDLKTGEIYYNNVYTYASREKRDLADPLTIKEINLIYQNDLKNLFSDLVKQASSNYSPGVSEAEILEKYKKDTWIINKGTIAGFIVGKNVTSANRKHRFRVVESSPYVSLLSLQRGNKSDIQIGSKIKLFGNKKANTNSAKILVSQVEYVDSYMFDKDLRGYDKSTVTQWFKDYLSSICKHFVVPSDPKEIYKFQQEVAYYGTTSSNELIGNLVRPDYIILPKIIYAYVVENEGQKSAGFSTSVSTLNVLLEIQLIDVDTGIILKSKRYLAARDQEQVENLASVNMSTLFPGLVKDGIITLCESLSDEFNATFVEASLKKSKNTYDINYLQGSGLKNGQILPVYRTMKKVEDKNGNFIGNLEENVGRVRIIDRGENFYAKPLYSSIKLKSGDRIRGFTAPEKLSENLVLVHNVSSQTRTESQKELPNNLILSNYYSVISNIPNLTPVIDEGNQKFLESLRSSFQGGFYEVMRENESVVDITYFSNIESVIVNKEKIHDTRIDITEGLILTLLGKNKTDELFKGKEGLLVTIGDEKESKSKDKKRSKKNIVLKGMTEKDINKKYFETNHTLFQKIISEISNNL